MTRNLDAWQKDLDTLIQIPRDVALASFNDWYGQEIPVPWTLMDTPFAAMGYAAVEIAIFMIDDRQLRRVPAKVFHSNLLIPKSTPPKGP